MIFSVLIERLGSGIPCFYTAPILFRSIYGTTTLRTSRKIPVLVSTFSLTAGLVPSASLRSSTILLTSNGKAATVSSAYATMISL